MFHWIFRDPQMIGQHPRWYQCSCPLSSQYTEICRIWYHRDMRRWLLLSVIEILLDESILTFEFTRCFKASRPSGSIVSKFKSRGTGTNPCSLMIYIISGMLMADIIISDPFGKFMVYNRSKFYQLLPINKILDHI